MDMAIRVIYHPSPAQALREANERADDALRAAEIAVLHAKIAGDLKKLVDSLPVQTVRGFTRRAK
jgi:hypothetical protein